MNSIHKILIEDIENAPNGTLTITFDEKISDIKSNGNIKADLVVKSLGEFIEVHGNVIGKFILECDLCLKEYEEELAFQIDEIFAKNTLLDEYGQETEIKEGQFITDLENADEIDICDLLYQSVILNLPNKQVCGINCSEDVFETDENFVVQDSRMDVFKNIHIKRNPLDKQEK